MTLRAQLHGLARDSARLLGMAALRMRGDWTGYLFNPAHLADPYPMYERVRNAGPWVRTRTGTVTAHHAVIDTIARNPATTTGTAARESFVEGTSRFQEWLFTKPDRGDVIDPLGPDSMIGMDGADHARLRRLVSKAFTPGAIAQLRPELAAITEELVDDVADGEPFDLMADIANVLPVRAICAVLGIPDDDHAQFKEWGRAIAADLDAMAPAWRQRRAGVALAELTDYLQALITARRRDPGDDLVSRMAVVEEGGDQLTDRELLSTCMLLLVAGFETTVNLIGNGTLALLDHPDRQAWLREDLSRVPGAVEEMLRFDAPVQVIARIPGEPMEVDGHHLEAGETMVLFLGGANRDPAVFDAPDELRLDRDNARKHLAFASGPHYCLGAALARLEGEIAFTTLLERLGRLELAGRPRRRPTFVLRGLDTLPVRPTT